MHYRFSVAVNDPATWNPAEDVSGLSTNNIIVIVVSSVLGLLLLLCLIILLIWCKKTEKCCFRTRGRSRPGRADGLNQQSPEAQGLTYELGPIDVNQRPIIKNQYRRPN